MNNELNIALFCIAFHAKLSQSGVECSPARHQVIAAHAAEAAEAGVKEFNARFPEAQG